MNVSYSAASLKLVLPVSISNLAMYLSAVMPVIIFRACSWACTILSQSGSPKVLSIPASSSARVENLKEWYRTALVSFSAQTYTIPPHMKERAYRIFMLSSMNVTSCIVMECIVSPQLWTDISHFWTGPLALIQ